MLYLPMLLSLFIWVVNGYKILMLPTFYKSHVITYARVARILKDAGHEVDILALVKYKELIDQMDLNSILVHPKEFTDPTEDPEFMANMLNASTFWTFLPYQDEMSNSVAYHCNDILKDANVQGQIKQKVYDLVILDGEGNVRCLMVLPYRHSIKYMVLSVVSGGWAAGMPTTPSAEGYFPAIAFEDPSNPAVLERWTSFLLELYTFLFSLPAVQSQDFITQHAPNRPHITMDELYSKAELFVTQMESFCLDQPRTQASHYKYLGGLNTLPAKPLQGIFGDFASNATHGLVVTSFGSVVKRVPQMILEKMLAAFSKIPQKVVIRYDSAMPSEVPNNVLLAKWLPQNDLLGHPNTVLFITHGGRNGQAEALYHGVPLLTLPIFYDQTYNAQRTVIKGFGKMLSFHHFTSEELLESINDVLNDPSYKQRIANCSRIFRALPDSKETLVFWVEHILKHGGDHLKPAAINMSTWKFFNLDILFICFICIHFLFHIGRRLLMFSFRLLRGFIRTKTA